MRTLFVTLFIGSFFLHEANAQSPKMMETPVSRFMIMLDEDMSTLMEMDGKTTMALAMQLDNQEARKIMTESFNILQNMLSDSADLVLLPIETLKGAVKYSNMDFPIGTLKKAAKGSDFDQYVQVDIMVERPQSTTFTTTEETGVGGKLAVSSTTERTKIRPQIRVILKFANADGKNIGRYVGKYKHDEKFELDAAGIGIAGYQLTQTLAVEPLPYHFLLTKAVEDLIAQLPK